MAKISIRCGHLECGREGVEAEFARDKDLAAFLRALSNESRKGGLIAAVRRMKRALRDLAGRTDEALRMGVRP